MTETDASDRLLPRTTARSERSPTAETAILLVGFFLVQLPLTILGLLGAVALSPAVIIQPWTLVTSVYAHAGPIRLLGNLVGLVVFGSVIERVSSRARFHAFFLTTGILAGLFEVVFGSLLALSPRGVLGASGAIFALMGYAITGNGVADRVLDTLDHATDADWLGTAALIGFAGVIAVLLSGPGTALIAHATGLALGLFAGRFRLLHVSSGRAANEQGR